MIFLPLPMSVLTDKKDRSQIFSCQIFRTDLIKTDNQNVVLAINYELPEKKNSSE